MRPTSVAAVQITNITSPQNGTDPFIQSNRSDLLAVEEPLEIRIIHGPEKAREEKSISVTMCTPGNEVELATGFLFTEGIIQSPDDILSTKYAAGQSLVLNEENIVEVDLRPGIVFDPQKLERHFYTSSSCGVCGKSSISAVKNVMKGATGESNMKTTATVIIGLPESLRKQQEVFERTGGLHASALFDPEGRLLLTREDVGRHNALDKLIGAAMIAGIIPLNRHILLLSGRASFELIQKAAMAGIPIVCAVGAPSSLAVEMAKDSKITLLGFLREKRFNIYCGEERIDNR